MLGNQGALPDLCADIVEKTRLHDWEAAAIAHDAAIHRAQDADVTDRTRALSVLATALADVPLGEGPELAILAGELMDLDADPAQALGVLVPRVAEGLETAARFPALWASAGGADLPSSEDTAQVTAVLELLNADPEGLSLPPDQAGHATEAWFSVGTWARGVLVPLQRREVRDRLPHRERLTEAVEASAGVVPSAGWLRGLLRVLDDETLIVLDRAEGRGYEMTIGGIGDNVQLHILLAAALIGDGLMKGAPLDPEWVAAATDGDPQPVGGIEGRFDLLDAHGDPICDEGRPADIPSLDDRRVIVVDPAPSPRTWVTGRAYPLMRPTLVLDRPLSSSEAAHWLGKVTPAAG